jgi:hypothetical protein
MSSGDFEAALTALHRQIEVSQYIVSCPAAVRSLVSSIPPSSRIHRP